MKTTLKIAVFRHGQSRYEKGNAPCTVNSAFDLCVKAKSLNETALEKDQACSDAIREVNESAKKLITCFEPSRPIMFVSSPVARCLHTAKVIRDTLEPANSIIIAEAALGEVANFSWDLFEPLMNGGQVVGPDYKFGIDKVQSNYLGLGYPDYFILDMAHAIPDEVKKQWPAAYVEKISVFEKFEEVTRRTLCYIRRLNRLPRGQYVLVTHDAGLMYLLGKYTGGRQSSMKPGDFLTIERSTVDPNKLVVTQAGDITDGDSGTDFIAQFFAQ